MEDSSQNRIGAYQRLQLLGAGGQGRVFKAVCVEDNPADVPQGALVAIKILQRQAADEEAVRRQQRQSEVLHGLVHPNIVRYLECFFKSEGEWDEAMCLVMELLDGDDLKTLLKERPAGLPFESARGILSQCLEGLIYARDKGVFHRDIKPSNIHIVLDGTVKLIDFGIAHIDEGGTTTTGDFKGTFDYMSPDFVQVPHLKEYEPCDIFSLGVCFYQTLTGQLPFPALEGNIPIAFVTRWQDLKGLDVSFKAKIFRVYPHARAFILKCLAMRREDRFQNFDEMREALQAIKPRTIRHKGGETYECEEWIGRGGFGEVYRARRVRDGATVAIKYLSAAQHSPHRFIKEARLIQEFRHPHIVEYVDFLQMDRSDDTRAYFLVMEYLDGMPAATLRSRVKNAEEGLPTEEALILFDGYLDALQYLHAGNGQDIIIHRDIKPSNLYAPAGEPDRAKIFDLGVARDVQGTATAGSIPGTLDYMPPEFAAGEDRGTARSDIYSLGLCLYEALTGAPVFPPLPRAEKDAWPLFLERARIEPRLDFSKPAFQECPALADIVKRALAMKPRRRFASAEAMKLEIRKALAYLRPAAPLPEPVLPAEPKPAIPAAPAPSPAPPEPETLMGGEVSAKGDLDLSTVAPMEGSTRAPATIGTAGGTVGGTTMGAGTHTVAPTPGTMAGDGLGSRLEQYKVQRARRRKWSWAAAALLTVALLVGGFTLGPGLLGRRQQHREKSVRIELEDFLSEPAKATADYVERLQSCQKRMDELAVKPKELDRELTSRIGELPAAFSNKIMKILEALDSPGKVDAGIRTPLVEADQLIKELELVSGSGWLGAVSDMKPTLVSSRDAYDTALRLREENENADLLKEKMQEQAELLAIDANQVKTRDGLKNLLDKYSKFRRNQDLPEESKTKLDQAVFACFLKWVDQAAEQTIQAYTRNGVNSDEKVQVSFEEILALGQGQPWNRAEEIKPLVEKVTGAKETAILAQDEIDKKNAYKITKAKRRLQEFQSQVQTASSAMQVADISEELVSIQSGWPDSVRANAAVAKELKAAALACTASLSDILSDRAPLSDRAGRIDAVEQLLNRPGVKSLIDPEKTLAKALAREREIFILRVDNQSGRDITLRTGSRRGESQKISAGQTMDWKLPVKTAKKRNVTAQPVDKGFEAQELGVHIIPGGGEDWTLSSFDLTRVLVSWNPEKAAANGPPVRAFWVAGGKLSPVDNGELRTPGDYKIQFERDDHKSITRPVQIQKAVKKYDVRGPAEWTPQPNLKTLREMLDLRKKEEWKNLARELAEPNKLDFTWKGYVSEYRDLKKVCASKVEEDIKKSIPKADASVRDYCESLYQVSDPFAQRPRIRDPLELNLTGFPDYPPQMIINDSTRAEYRRLKAWAAETEALDRSEWDDLAGRLKKLAKELQELDASVADRCEFESELLGWDSSVLPPQRDLLKDPEIDRWWAHREFFRQNMPSMQRAALEQLATFAKNDGKLNKYDVLLGSAAAANLFEKYVNQVTRDIDSGEYRVDKLVKEQNLEKVRAHYLADYRVPCQELAGPLLELASKVDDSVLQDAAEYFEDSNNNPGMDLVIRFFMNKGGDRVQRAFGGISLDPVHEATWETLEELLNDKPADR